MDEGKVMYSKILVPLDGSKLAECVFPHLKMLIGGCQVQEVVFLRAVEPFQLPRRDEYVLSPEDIDKINVQTVTEARDYLKQTAERLHSAGIKTSWEVIPGKPGEVIAEYASGHGIELILMATHGRSGVSRWARGGVADRVLRSACVPVLMIRAPGCAPGI
jgi:nucleotide-binding universal stress UspA family protein